MNGLTIFAKQQSKSETILKSDKLRQLILIFLDEESIKQLWLLNRKFRDVYVKESYN